MLKQGENPLWDYFKISNEDASKAVCILCKKNLSRGSKDFHKMTTTTNFCRSFGFGTSLVLVIAIFRSFACININFFLNFLVYQRDSKVFLNILPLFMCTGCLISDGRCCYQTLSRFHFFKIVGQTVLLFQLAVTLLVSEC